MKIWPNFGTVTYGKFPGGPVSEGFLFCEVLFSGSWRKNIQSLSIGDVARVTKWPKRNISLLRKTYRFQSSGLTFSFSSNPFERFSPWQNKHSLKFSQHDIVVAWHGSYWLTHPKKWMMLRVNMIKSYQIDGLALATFYRTILALSNAYFILSPYDICKGFHTPARWHAMISGETPITTTIHKNKCPTTVTPGLCCYKLFH